MSLIQYLQLVLLLYVKQLRDSLMIGRIARGGFFTGKSSCDIGQSGAKQLVAAVALMPLLILFAAYTAALTRTAFQ